MAGTTKQEQSLAPAEQRSLEQWINKGYRGAVIMIVVLSGIYALWPLDALPDIIPIIGQIDDAATLTAGGSSVIFLTVMRPLALAIARRPMLRAGCFAVIFLVGIVMIAGALAVFYGIYLLIDAL